MFYFIFLKLRFSLTLTPCVLVAMLSCSGEIVKKRYRNIVYPFTQMFQSGWLYFFFVSLFLKSVMFSKLSSFMPFLSLRDLQLKKCKIMARHSFFFISLNKNDIIIMNRLSLLVQLSIYSNFFNRCHSILLLLYSFSIIREC